MLRVMVLANLRKYLHNIDMKINILLLLFILRLPPVFPLASKVVFISETEEACALGWEFV